MKVFKENWLKSYSFWKAVILWFRRVLGIDEVIIGIDETTGKDYSCELKFQKDRKGNFYLIKRRLWYGKHEVK